jgi:hypothetical protein
MIEKISVYEPVKGIDVAAYTDGYSHDEYGFACLVSILGHDSAVKGISSAILSGREVEVQKPDGWLNMSRIKGEKYRTRSARLESGMLHQVVAIGSLLERLTEGSRLIYVGNSDPVTAVFNSIKDNYATPILPEWKEWLVHRLHSEGLLEPLQGNVRIVRHRLEEKQLDSIICEGVQQGSIRF